MNEITPEYKYAEGDFLADSLIHIDSTYKGHYSNKIQTTEYIMSHAETLDYLKGNIIKYIDRFGKKKGHNPEDLWKAVHYIAMMSYYANKMPKRSE